MIGSQGQAEGRAERAAAAAALAQAEASAVATAPGGSAALAGVGEACRGAARLELAVCSAARRVCRAEGTLEAQVAHELAAHATNAAVLEATAFTVLTAAGAAEAAAVAAKGALEAWRLASRAFRHPRGERVLRLRLPELLPLTHALVSAVHHAVASVERGRGSGSSIGSNRRALSPSGSGKAPGPGWAHEARQGAGDSDTRARLQAGARAASIALALLQPLAELVLPRPTSQAALRAASKGVAVATGALPQRDSDRPPPPLFDAPADVPGSVADGLRDTAYALLALFERSGAVRGLLGASQSICAVLRDLRAAAASGEAWAGQALSDLATLWFDPSLEDETAAAARPDGEMRFPTGKGWEEAPGPAGGLWVAGETAAMASADGAMILEPSMLALVIGARAVLLAPQCAPGGCGALPGVLRSEVALLRAALAEDVARCAAEEADAGEPGAASRDLGPTDADVLQAARGLLAAGFAGAAWELQLDVEKAGSALVASNTGVLADRLLAGLLVGKSRLADWHRLAGQAAAIGPGASLVVARAAWRLGDLDAAAAMAEALTAGWAVEAARGSNLSDQAQVQALGALLLRTALLASRRGAASEPRQEGTAAESASATAPAKAASLLSRQPSALQSKGAAQALVPLVVDAFGLHVRTRSQLAATGRLLLSLGAGRYMATCAMAVDILLRAGRFQEVAILVGGVVARASDEPIMHRLAKAWDTSTHAVAATRKQRRAISMRAAVAASANRRSANAAATHAPLVAAPVANESGGGGDEADDDSRDAGDESDDAYEDDDVGEEADAGEQADGTEHEAEGSMELRGDDSGLDESIDDGCDQDEEEIEQGEQAEEVAEQRTGKFDSKMVKQTEAMITMGAMKVANATNQGEPAQRDGLQGPHYNQASPLMVLLPCNRLQAAEVARKAARRRVSETTTTPVGGAANAAAARRRPSSNETDAAEMASLVRQLAAAGSDPSLSVTAARCGRMWRQAMLNGRGGHLDDDAVEAVLGRWAALKADSGQECTSGSSSSSSASAEQDGCVVAGVLRRLLALLPRDQADAIAGIQLPLKGVLAAGMGGIAPSTAAAWLRCSMCLVAAALPRMQAAGALDDAAALVAMSAISVRGAWALQTAVGGLSAAAPRTELCAGLRGEAAAPGRAGSGSATSTLEQLLASKRYQSQSPIGSGSADASAVAAAPSLVTGLSLAKLAALSAGRGRPVGGAGHTAGPPDAVGAFAKRHPLFAAQSAIAEAEAALAAAAEAGHTAGAGADDGAEQAWGPPTLDWDEVHAGAGGSAGSDGLGPGIDEVEVGGAVADDARVQSAQAVLARAQAALAVQSCIRSLKACNASLSRSLAANSRMAELMARQVAQKRRRPEESVRAPDLPPSALPALAAFNEARMRHAANDPLGAEQLYRKAIDDCDAAAAASPAKRAAGPGGQAVLPWGSVRQRAAASLAILLDDQGRAAEADTVRARCPGQLAGGSALVSTTPAPGLPRGASRLCIPWPAGVEPGAK
ncbi:unnamed protein product [Symbiodinium sp. KB8]|nr:unnamed protein product [Symbiodinium sp. KB8]